MKKNNVKYLIVGLGNPGKEYEHTRHNVGFDTVTALADEFGEKFTLGRLAEVAVIKYKGRTLILLKPTTYMNLSGKAVQYYLQTENIPVSNLLVVSDDLALPFGKLRMKLKGGAGGHNGLKDIEAKINTSDYTRLRFGVGNHYFRGQQVDYVLGKWTEEEQQSINDRIVMAKEFVKSFVTIGGELTMSNLNNK